MFCKYCGTQMDDNAKFCPKCGKSKDENLNEITSEDIVTDDTVQYTLKPTFNFFHLFIPNFAKYLLLCFFWYIIIVDREYSENVIGFVLISYFAVAIIFGISILCVTFSQKRKMEKMEYLFYNSKLKYRKDYIDKTENEIRYEDVGDVMLRQTLVDSWFSFGTIILNLKSGDKAHGMENFEIKYIKNVKEEYEHIKEIIYKGNNIKDINEE